MGPGQIGLDGIARLGGLGQEVDVHLVGAQLGTLMAQMGQIERVGVAFGLTESKGFPRPVLATADQDVINLGEGRAADQAVNAVQVSVAGRSTPIVKSMRE